MEVSSAWPFSLTIWNISQWDSRSWHCDRGPGRLAGTGPAGVSSMGPCDSILHDHDFEHLLGVLVGEFALVDQGGNVGV